MLITRNTLLALILTSLALPACAQDASYDSTTQITGGTLVETLQHVSFMKSVKEMLAPQVSTVIVRGNQKARISKESTEITDLDKETITRIDNMRKTYTVTTFAQMRAAFENMPAQMDKAKAQVNQAQAQAQVQPAPPPSTVKVTYDVGVKNTGVTKVVNGQNAQEQIVTMSMIATDTSAPLAAGTNPVTYTVTSDVWIAPDPPELVAVRAFDVRFGQKLMQGVDMSAMMNEMKELRSQSQGMTQLFAGKPGAQEGMVRMGEELAKIKGTRILETTSMGGVVPASTQGEAAAPSQTTPTTVSGAIGSALANSAFGAFKKKPKPADPASAPAPVAANPAPAGMQNVVLMSMTTQMTNFSQSPGPTNAFQIPAGFKLVTIPTL